MSDGTRQICLDRLLAETEGFKPPQVASRLARCAERQERGSGLRPPQNNEVDSPVVGQVDISMTVDRVRYAEMTAKAVGLKIPKQQRGTDSRP